MGHSAGFLFLLICSPCFWAQRTLSLDLFPMLFSPSLTVWAQRTLSLDLFPSLFPPPLTVWAQRTLSLDLFPWLFPLLLALWAQRRISLNLFPIISRLNVVQSQEICCLCPKSFLGPEKLGYTHLISICCTQKFRKPWGINSRNLLLCLIAILLAYADKKKGLAAPAQDLSPALDAPSPSSHARFSAAAEVPLPEP